MLIAAEAMRRLPRFQSYGRYPDNLKFGDFRVSYAGDMPTGFSEYGTIRNDLLSVGATGIALVLGVVLLYFMRLRALLVMGITIGVGLVWTFGLTQLVIGHLNMATGFLVSIVAGNGINVGILYQARYFEERRGGTPTEEALRTSVRATCVNRCTRNWPITAWKNPSPRGWF